MTSLDKYIRLVGGLAGRNLSTAENILTLDSYSYNGLHTVFHFNQRISHGINIINIKSSIKLKDLIIVVEPYSHAYYAAKHLQDVLKYAN